MQWGSAYGIEIVAYVGDTPRNATQSAVNLLPNPQVQEIKQTAERLSKLNIDPDEMAYLDLDSLYMGSDLLDSSIAALESRVKAGSSHPAVFRTLGDRYLEAGLVSQAGKRYQQAIEKAQKARDERELFLAQSGWDRVVKYQMPTSTQPAQ
jgi:tetratricopeptide (TPR) repeat protein